jgi:hypothetical protein
MFFEDGTGSGVLVLGLKMVLVMGFLKMVLVLDPSRVTHQDAWPKMGF